MKKEIKKYTTVCDICELELLDSGIRTNCGRFEEPYFKTNKFDLCYSCAGKLFATQIGNKVSEEKLQDMIERAKALINPESPFGTLDIEDLLPKGGFIGTNPAETFKTTGVNEMVQVTSNSLETPVESQQEALNGMFKVHKSSEMKVQTKHTSLDSIDDPKNLSDL